MTRFLLLTLFLPLAAADTATPERPNVILIMADDLGPGMLGHAGQKIVRTPHIDRLASEGIRFSNYYDHQRAHGFFPPYLWRDGKKFDLPGNNRIDCGKMSETGTDPVGSGGGTYSQDVFLESMLKFLREHRDERFFLYHPTQLPHGPVAVTRLHPDYAGRADLTLSEKKYATMVRLLDDTVGRIMKELKALGLDEKTIVFFSSDNGHETYYQNAAGQLPKRVWRSGKLADGSPANLTDRKWRTSTEGDVFDGAGGRAGLKWCAFQGGIHCPMIVRWPGRIEAGRTTALLATHYDFMPTLAEIAGVRPPRQKDGISYLPTLLGRKQTEDHDWVFVQSNGPRSRSTLITREGWKLIQLKDQSFQLYQVLEDPGERDNVAGAHPDLVASLVKIFTAQLRSERPDLAAD